MSSRPIAFVPLPGQIGRAMSAAAAAEAAGVLIEQQEFEAIAASLAFLADERDWIIPAWRARIERDRAGVANHPALAALLDGLPEARVTHVRSFLLAASDTRSASRPDAAPDAEDLSDITDPTEPA